MKHLVVKSYPVLHNSFLLDAYERQIVHVQMSSIVKKVLKT